MNLKFAIAGLGYVGLSLAVLLSRRHEVVALDVVSEKVEMINNGISPLDDAEIIEYLANKKLNLLCTLDVQKAYSDADYVIVSVPTNYDEAKGSFDTSHVEEVIETVTKLNSRATIVIKSTVPVGYTERISEKYPQSNLLFSPEFLREGKALYDNLHPSRIIVGIPEHCKTPDMTTRAMRFAKALEEGALDDEVPVLLMRATESEAVKLFSNAYLATRVAFFNELDTYAEELALDSKSIIQGMTPDSRIGDHYCNPSFGYGGYCLPKDTKQLKANFSGIRQSLVSAVVKSNELKKDQVAEKIIDKLPERKGTVGAYRLVMKSGSDNFRESAIQGVISRLVEQGIEVVVYEPEMNAAVFHGCRVIANLDEFISMSDVVMVNRMSEEVEKAHSKIYTRDCFFND